MRYLTISFSYQSSSKSRVFYSDGIFQFELAAAPCVPKPYVARTSTAGQIEVNARKETGSRDGWGR